MATAAATGRPAPEPSNADPEAAHGQLLHRLPGTAPDGREGAHDDLVKAMGISGISKGQGQPAVRGDR